MKSRILSFLSIAMIVSLLFCCIPAHADEQGDNDGWLSITIGDENSLFSRENIKVDVYLIATGTTYGEWTMLEDFSDIEVYTRTDGSASINLRLTQISQRIADRSIAPTQSVTSDESGKAVVKELQRGIYFVKLSSDDPSLTFSPMLLSAPNKDGSVQIRAVAKFEYVTPAPPTPTPTPTPRPTPTPFETPEITPTTPPERTVTPSPAVTPTPSPTPAPPTPTPVFTPTPTPVPNVTPIPPHVPAQTPHPNETVVSLDDYETALGLGNIQMHVGVCFE